MPAEATRSLLHSSHFPLTVAVLSIIAFVSFSNIWGHDKPHVIGFRGPLAGDRWEPVSNGTTRQMLHRRLDPYQCTKDIPCHNVACCKIIYKFPFQHCPIHDTYVLIPVQVALSSAVMLEPVALETHSAAPTALVNVTPNLNVVLMPTRQARRAP
jgi:hypothetical protein